MSKWIHTSRPLARTRTDKGDSGHFSLVPSALQEELFPLSGTAAEVSPESSSTFVNNMTLPVHRWFRFSAGFSAQWAESVIRQATLTGPVRVLDPFVGSGTTLLSAELVGAESWGIEAHPFIYRIARAKLAWRTDPDRYLEKVKRLWDIATDLEPDIDDYPDLIRKCYDDHTLAQLDVLRRAYETVSDNTPATDLAWLTLVASLRKASKAGTAQWQYILPNKRKRAPSPAHVAFDEYCSMIYEDMQIARFVRGPRAKVLRGDARDCCGIPSHTINLVITSPPYPNNYDYADATRLEMSFMREINCWGDLQNAVRQHLIRSCSQHVPERSIDLKTVLATPQLQPISTELTEVCRELAEVRESKAGRKTYHLMVACYFRDLALTWKALHSVCDSPSKVCFVVGDSAPYGVYVPVVPWLGSLALNAGFKSYTFEKTRDRNVKWKNRKHRVPLQEGRLWVEG